ncbi:hypothetical protein FRC12_009224 [Ceratobasidium sp. 428]|nr:hypothetical protein FRC12_009224 [Ceratobasidium sp. 428]
MLTPSNDPSVMTRMDELEGGTDGVEPHQPDPEERMEGTTQIGTHKVKGRLNKGVEVLIKGMGLSELTLLLKPKANNKEGVLELER